MKYPRGKHPNSLKALKPFTKGENGQSPGGDTLTSALKRALFYDKVKQKQFIESTIEGAILREPAPFHEVWNRVEGPVVETPPSQDNRVVNYVFVLPNGTKVSPRALIDYANSEK